MKTSLRSRVKNGESVLGTWNTVGSTMVTEAIASSGIDFIFIDFEHGPIKLDSVSQFVSVCRQHNCSPIVRVPNLADWMILQALDQGAEGIIVPHIEDKSSAEKLVKMTKYYPLGERGFSPFTKAGNFGADASSHVKRSNDETITMIIIESAEGLKNIDQILEVKEIDVVFFGTYDLSQSIGHPGETRHPKLLELLGPAIEKVKKAGKCPGGFLAQTHDDLQWLKTLGLQLFVYDVDSSLIQKTYRAAYSAFKNSKGQL